MIHTFFFRGAPLRYLDLGKGPKTIVLLHGYLENLEIWNGFSTGLAKEFRVICPDTPGHGESGILDKVHHPDLLAEAIHTMLEHAGVNECVMAGHSMGGYTLFSFLEKYPFLLKGICLLHSTPFADNEEKRKNRDREIALVREGKQEMLYTLNVPNGFAPENRSLLPDKVTFAIEVARKTNPEGIISILEGMKVRPDRQELLRHCGKPVLFTLGRKDPYISPEIIAPIAASTPLSETVWLEHSGHNGFLEEQEKVTAAVSGFIRRCFSVN